VLRSPNPILFPRPRTRADALVHQNADRPQGPLYVRTRGGHAAGGRARRPAVAARSGVGGVLRRVRRAPGRAQERQEPLLRRLRRRAVPPVPPPRPRARRLTGNKGEHIPPALISSELRPLVGVSVV
jgi:hypothetical protein